MSEPIKISLRFGERFERQLRNHGMSLDPVSHLVLRLDGTWISGENAYNEVRAVGFFTELLTMLRDLDGGATNKKSLLFDDTYLSLSRDGSELTIGHRYSEAAIDDQKKRLRIATEATAELDEVALAAIEGAEQVSERVKELVDDSDHPKLTRLDERIEVARERFGAE